MLHLHASPKIINNQNDNKMETDGQSFPERASAQEKKFSKEQIERRPPTEQLMHHKQHSKSYSSNVFIKTPHSVVRTHFSTCFLYIKISPHAKPPTISEGSN